MALIVLRPSTIGDYDTWTLGAGSTKPLAVDPGNPAVHDDNTSYISMAATGATKQSFKMGSRPEMAALAAVRIIARVGLGGPVDNAVTLSVFARLGGVDGTAVGVATTGNYVTGNSALPRPGGGTWSVADILDASLQIGCWVSDWNGNGGSTARVTSLAIELDYTAVPGQIGATREVASRRLRMYRKPVNGLLEVRAPALFLDPELTDPVVVSHRALPSQIAFGGGLKAWQRRRFVLLASDYDPNTREVVLTLRDARHYLCTYWDVGLSRKTSGPTHDGIARLDLGNTRSYTRTLKAWVEDPGSRTIVERQPDQEKIDYLGQLFEGASTNYVKNSSFAGGSTDWTDAGTGLNGSAITLDTSTLLFETGVTPNSTKLLAGNPIPANGLTRRQLLGNFNANTRLKISVDHLDASAQTMYCYILRSVDGNWWNDSTATWGSFSATMNALPLSGTSSWARWVSKVINVGGSATDITVYVGWGDGAGVAGQVNYVAHVQAEVGRIASSRIVTPAGATYTRSADSLLISNNTGKRAWPAARGTFYCQVIPSWNSADIDANRTIAYVGHDANNYEWIYYDQANARWAFERKVASTIYRAVKAGSVTRGTTYEIAARWTSDQGELDLPNFTASIFVDGAKGTDVATGAAPTETATVNLERGSKAGAEHAEAALIHTYITQQVLTDNEIARLP